MHGALEMNKKSATQFKGHMEQVIRELSSALVLAQAVSTPEEFIAQEIDPLLEKISREGMGSLTRAERKLLAKAREKIAGES